ncbi:MAG: YbjQ family protein [Longimicrobiales bacterium]
MIVTTTGDIHGRRVTENLGLVRGNTIRARFIGRDIMAVFRAMAGGEIGEYTKMLAEAREQAIDRMINEADALGADAIIMTRFQTSMIMSAAAEIMCYGTAVKTEAV